MSIEDRLAELEQPPPGCDLLDVDLLLRECGYICYVDNDVIFYANEGWGSYFTFPRSKSTIPQGRLEEIIRIVRQHL